MAQSKKMRDRESLKEIFRGRELEKLRKRGILRTVVEKCRQPAD